MAKIQGVEIPPKDSLLHDLLVIDSKTEDFFKLLVKVDPSVHGFDSKGNYLHWNGFTTCAREFKENKEIAYLVLRQKRALTPHGHLIDELGRPFIYTENGLMAKLHQISQMITFDHLNIATAQDKHLHLAKSVIMEEAISSAQLEGAVTTRKVAKEMLETGREPKNLSEQMIVNNWNLIQSTEDYKYAPLSLELILFFNKIATEDALENDHQAGEFRNGQVFVADTVSGETVHEPPPHERIEQMLEMVCLYANTEHKIGGEFIHPIIKACVLHFMIGYIHPFFDGNGRTARALFYWYMLKSGYENFRFISISALLKAAPKKYMRSYLYTETDGNDLTHFIDYQLTIIIRALERFTTYIKDKGAELQNAIEAIKTSPLYDSLSLQHITILEKALKHSGRTFTVKEIENDFNVSSTAARGYLDKLAKMGLLIKFTLSGRTQGYIAPANLRERLCVS